jgi:hypothetical protein
MAPLIESLMQEALQIILNLYLATIIMLMVNQIELLLLLLFIALLLGIFNYISETNHVSRVCNFAAILCL